MVPIWRKKILPRDRGICWKDGHFFGCRPSVFYYSDVYCLMREGVSDMHCMSDAYLSEELEMEYQSKISL